MTRRPIFATLAAAALLTPSLGCQVDKSETPLSPSVAGPIAGVEITAPRILEPANGTKLKASQQPITFIVETSTTTGVRPIAYTFEVASDNSFETKMYARSGVLPGPDGRAKVTLEALETGRTYVWRTRAEDGANSSGYSVANFEVLPRPQLDPPPPLSPINNAQASSRRPDLVVGTATRNSAITSVSYEFQVAGDIAFAGVVAAGTRGESGGNTSFNVGTDLNASATYYWRVRSIDSEITSAWSATQSFRTPAAAPAPSPSPGPAPGGPCNSSNPLSIVECERAKYGHMDRGQTVEFLRAVARSLNRNGIGGNPFGILRKAGGNQCGGYSCDIICAGQGTGQRQHDVLSDWDGSQAPTWGPAHTYPGIRVDVCEIQ